MGGRRIAVHIAYGPESRAFVHSGLSDRLIDGGYELVFAATEPNAPELAETPGGALAAPAAIEPRGLTRLRRLRGRFEPPSLPGLAVRSAETALASLRGGDPAWRTWLRRHEIDLLLAGSYSSVRTLPALDAAARLGIGSVVLANSWKDVHKNPSCGPKLAGLGVFAESERRAFLLANPTFAAVNVRSIGSLHGAAAVRAVPTPRRRLCEELGLDPARPFLCYAAAQNGERERGLLDALLRLCARLPGRPGLAVRLNPMDAADWTQAYASNPDIAFQRPRWSWNREREWICPSPVDAAPWSGMLRHAAAVISRPSTVVWEAAAAGRTTITVAWGESEQAWEAADFVEARRRGWVRGVTEQGGLEQALRDELEQPRPPSAAPPGDPVERAARIVETALRPAGGRVPALAQAVREGAR